mmetsp:Transcript_19838/g.31064  ORF Transcript_19838/g.31064 Transcript_19838/m.31064 type:complete len:95 (+) Transcript_19838:26-310(+)|eukprot:CAMPEP_0184310906 /NCGR_PEP_ID=MMETSP1049-20130417/36059_1 /TAXON_ID=77928 /ORGANISM="Proteomonas sulcata, Strain CCMP704" /LENGTH=94 /DNA_ID=CAMNT_0026625701 /DNA_START=24 /DNA_END=308 /DNA_ORIENTATION=+
MLHKVLDTASTGFYSHHWIKPHASKFPHEKEYWPDSHTQPDYTTSTNALRGTMNEVSSALHLGLHRQGILYQDKDLIPSKNKPVGSVWVCGENV